jgi:hypothetical protein
MGCDVFLGLQMIYFVFRMSPVSRKASWKEKAERNVCGVWPFFVRWKYSQSKS